MKHLITSLILTLTIYSVSIGQDFKNDIKEGLYLWSPRLVIEQNADSIRIVDLRGSKTHLYKVADVTFDSLRKANMISESDPMWNKIKSTDIERLIKPSKIIDIIELSELRYSIIFANEKGLMSANFIKCDFGYEIYLSRNHEHIQNDTTNYFKIYAFTLNDLKKLQSLKNFNDINKSDFELLNEYMKNIFSDNEKLLKDNMTFGIHIEGYQTMGIIEVYEIMIKSLLKLKYNPLIDPNDFDKMSIKYKTKE